MESPLTSDDASLRGVCPACGTLFVADVPSEADLAAYYNSAYAVVPGEISEARSIDGVLDPLTAPLRRRAYASLLGPELIVIARTVAA